MRFHVWMMHITSETMACGCVSGREGPETNESRANGRLDEQKFGKAVCAVASWNEASAATHLAMFALRHLIGAITTPPVGAASMIARRGALPANGLLGALAMPSAGSSWALWARSLATHTVTPPLNWRGRQPPPGYMPRAEPITEEHIGKTFLVHSGKEHKRVKVTAQMVMHKFGEFVLTRKRPKKAEKPVQQKKK